MSVELQVAVDDQPSHLCVITARATRLQNKKKVSQYSSLALKSIAFDSAGHIENLPEELSKPDYEPIRRALMAALPVRANDHEQACEQSFPECDARLSQAPVRAWFDPDLLQAQSLDLHVTCAGNLAHPDASGPVAFIAMHLVHGADLPVTQITLDGTSATIRVPGRLGPDEVASMRVVGGHYAPGLTVLSTGLRAVLPLQPLCVTSVMRLPPVEGVSANLESVVLHHTADSSQDRTCVANVADNYFLMRLPFYEARSQHRVEVERLGAAKMAATWFGSVPPLEMPLLIEQLSFTWQPNCTYSLVSSDCPRAWLGGVECEAASEHPDFCSYTCTAQASIDLPASVDFVTRDNVHRWSDKLSLPGETLSRLLDAKARVIKVRFPEWQDIPFIERSRIASVELTLPDRSNVHIDLSRSIFDLDMKLGEHRKLDDVEIPAGGFECGAKIRYQVIGLPRNSSRGELEVDDGSIEIPTPACEDFTCTGIESSVRLGLLGRRPHGVLGPSPFGTGVYVGGDMMGRYLPWGEWWFLEFGYTVALGNREYVASRTSGTSPEWTPYGRLGYRLAVGLRTMRLPPVLPEFELGVGPEVGYGHVLTFGRASPLGGDAYFALQASLRAGRTALALRMHFGEELTVISMPAGKAKDLYSATYYGFELKYFFDLNP